MCEIKLDKMIMISVVQKSNVFGVMKENRMGLSLLRPGKDINGKDGNLKSSASCPVVSRALGSLPSVALSSRET